jgi:hypothetical protein
VEPSCVRARRHLAVGRTAGTWLWAGAQAMGCVRTWVDEGMGDLLTRAVRAGTFVSGMLHDRGRGLFAGRDAYCFWSFSAPSTLAGGPRAATWCQSLSRSGATPSLHVAIPKPDRPLPCGPGGQLSTGYG